MGFCWVLWFPSPAQKHSTTVTYEEECEKQEARVLFIWSEPEIICSLRNERIAKHSFANYVFGEIAAGDNINLHVL